jgi:hypothetical protein
VFDIPYVEPCGDRTITDYSSEDAELLPASLYRESSSVVQYNILSVSNSCTFLLFLLAYGISFSLERVSLSLEEEIDRAALRRALSSRTGYEESSTVAERQTGRPSSRLEAGEGRTVYVQTPAFPPRASSHWGAPENTVSVRTCSAFLIC